MGMVANTAGHPPALVTDTVIGMGLDPAIGTSACSDLDKITELNTVMATAMDLEEGTSPKAASDSDTDLDSNTAPNTDSNMGLVQPLRSATVMATSTATDTAINSE